MSRLKTLFRADAPLLTTLAALALLAPSVRPARADDAAGVTFFEQSVRPLLVEKCYQCHSAGAEKGAKGGLLLDSKAGWARGGDLGPALVPGDPDKSLLVRAVKYEDPDLQMPPKGKLSQAEIDVLVRWVKAGAPDPREGPAAPAAGAGHEAKVDVMAAAKSLWSLQPLSAAPPPAVKGAGWAKNAVDPFILAKLEAKGIAPNAPVDRRRLIRRAYLGVVGLPPAPEEVEAFVKDPDPQAYEKLVDELLASPRFGERWASHWLDVARYGESDGYEQDYDRPYAYHYRDFVIRALNDDLPYDAFVKWQLAGDEYDPENPLALAATGFLTAGTFPTQITEKEFESSRYNQLDDMTMTTGLAFLGLSVGCARCHDHKFDPIPTEDYYRLTSTFTTAIRSDVDVDVTPPAERQKAKEAFEAKRAELLAKVGAFEREQLPQKFAAYVEGLKGRGGPAPGAWSVLEVTGVTTRNGTTFSRQPDGSLLKTGGTPEKDVYTFTARADVPGVTAVRLEALAHESLPAKGPGLAGNGNFALGDFKVTAAPADGSAPAAEVKIASARATHQQDAATLSVAASIDADPVTGWAVDRGIGKDQAAIFQFEKPLPNFPGGTLLTFTLRFEHPNARHAIGRPRLSVTTSPTSVDFKGAEGPPAAVVQALARLAGGQPAEPPAAEAARLWFAATLPEYRAARDALAAHESAGTAAKREKMQVTSEGLPPVKNHADDRGYPHFYKQTYFLKRGDPNQKGQVVTQSFLRVLMRDGADATRWQAAPPPGWRTSYRRRALAEWITDTKHGAGDLLARVIVNRLWQHHMGRGIVATPSDFGTRGAPPTHPELLDFLASELVRNGWRLKPIHKLVLTSGAYATSGTHDAAKAAADPDNLLLWRKPLRRLEAEAVRDSMLSVSGMLDPAMYGPGTADANSRRRSVYFRLKRSALTPMMLVFDAPETLTPVGERATTTIAPQALLLMNNPQVRQYAKALARRAAPAGPATPPEAAVRSAYLIALGREPSAQESADAAAFVASQAASYQSAGRGDGKDLALADFCQALVCLNEFVYPE